MSEQCSSCHAPIVWALSPAGKASPIDAYVDTAKGNVMLLRPQGFLHVLAVVLTKDALRIARENRMPLHLSHWATCPDAPAHRARADAKAKAA